jgi:hypothetical protein
VKGCQLIIEIMLLKDVCEKEGEKAGALSIQVNAFKLFNVVSDANCARALSLPKSQDVIKGPS